jgi:hypothetical protein
MAEEILIKIELEKGDNEREVDNLTRKLTDLQIATANLQKANNELIKSGKQNSQEFVENTRQIELNKQKIAETTATRKGLIQTLVLEDNSIKALNIRNGELIKQRNSVTTATKEGRDEIKRLNAEIDRNNETIEDNLDKAGKQKKAIGGYTDAIKDSIPFFRQAEQAQNALSGGMSNFNKILIGSGIGLFVVLLGSLIAYLKGSEEGQNKLNRILAIGSAIFEQFMNVVEGFGEVIFEAFENPKKAALDLLSFLQSQFINRIVGIFELIPNLGRAVEQLFKGNFAEAGKIAYDSVAKVALGVENFTDKIAGFINETGKLIDQGIKNGEQLAALNAFIDKEERALLVRRAELGLEVAKKREEALKLEGDARKKVLLEAIALEEQLAARETNLAKVRLIQAERSLQANGDDKEALLEVAEARAAVFNAESAAFSNTLRFRKEIANLDEAEIKRKEKEAADAVELARKTAADIAAAEKEQFETNLEFLQTSSEEKLNVIKENYLNELTSKQEFEEAVSSLEIETLEARKAFLIANNQSIVDTESALLDKQLKKKEDTAAKEALIEKKKLENEQNIAKAKIGLAGQLGAFLESIAGKNKALAIAGIIIQKAAAIAQIIAQTAIANAQAIATFWITGGLPWTAINTAQAVLSIGSVVAEAATSISQINSQRRGGLLRKHALGGMLGGLLRGPTHERGGIPFTVDGQPGFEAEGDEAIINKKSTRRFRKELSFINSFNGWGVPFGKGGVTYQTGNIISANQTRQSAVQADNRSAIQDSLRTMMDNLPPIIVSVEDINARADEVSNQTQRANVV